MYIRKILKDNFTFTIKNATVNFMRGDVVFIKVNEENATMTIYQGNLELVYPIKKSNYLFENEHEDRFVEEVIDEIAERVAKKIEENKRIPANSLMDILF